MLLLRRMIVIHGSTLVPARAHTRTLDYLSLYILCIFPRIKIWMKTGNYLKRAKISTVEWKQVIIVCFRDNHSVFHSVVWHRMKLVPRGVQTCEVTKLAVPLHRWLWSSHLLNGSGLTWLCKTNTVDQIMNNRLINTLDDISKKSTKVTLYYWLYFLTNLSICVKLYK